MHEEITHFNWVGIYLLETQSNTLILGPYVGKPTPHTHIPLNSGICGAAASQAETIIVDDVKTDDRYIACSIETRSEIVVPIINKDGQVLGEIDIDSDTIKAFSLKDKELLEEIANIIADFVVTPKPDSTAAPSS